MDRASHFNDDEVIRLLRDDFVPVAVDEWYHIRRKDTEGDFYRKIVYQRDGMSPEADRSTQGFYIAAPDGALLRGWNNRDLPKLRRHLQAAVRSYSPPSSAALEAAVDRRYARDLEPGGVVVEVFSRIVRADWPAAKDEWQAHFRQATGRDHLWILKEEAAELATGKLPAAVARRLARFHLVDNTRGEPPMWRADELRQSTLRLTPAAGGGHQLEGEVVLRTGSGSRAYHAAALGRIEARAGKVERFDVVFRGEFAGEGRYTPGAPPGNFTLAVAFRLAQGGEADKVPPQGARELAEYLRPGGE